MTPGDRFTSPIVFPDGWRLVIERYAMHSAYHIELHGLMVPPVQQEMLAHVDPEQEFDIAREVLGNHQEMRACVMMPSAQREED